MTGYGEHASVDDLLNLVDAVLQIYACGEQDHQVCVVVAYEVDEAYETHVRYGVHALLLFFQ